MRGKYNYRLTSFKRLLQEQLALLRKAESEASMIARVILPILQNGLGISPLDIILEESLPGTSPQNKTGRADIVVRMAGKPVLVVECKAPGKSFEAEKLRREATEQAERYAIELQVDYVLLTNGYHWILTKGRSIVFEASDRETLIKRSRELYEWLKPSSLWYSATRLIIPPDFDLGHAILARCRNLAVTASDIRKLSHMREDLPHIVPRLEEEARKVLAVMKVDKFMKNMPYQRSVQVIHIDPTFLKYRQGAWLYDPIYRMHRVNEASFLNYCAKTDLKKLSLRAFIVGEDKTSDWAVRLSDICTRMLRDGWTIAIMSQKSLSDFKLRERDVVGEYVNLIHQEGDAFDYHFVRKPKTAAETRDKVNDYMFANQDFTFRSSEHDILRLKENCYYLARTK